MYPRDAKKALEPFVKAIRGGRGSGCSTETCSGGTGAPYVEIPHAAWQRCRAELDRAFGDAASRWDTVDTEATGDTGDTEATGDTEDTMRH